MSYIGKNPKVDSVKLDQSATVPSGANAEGQLYFNSGTGSISRGLKVYKNSQFVAIDKQLGDADTFHLLKASDLATSEWSAARNSTSTSFLNQNAVPFETTTASGAAGTFSNTSTGDALLTDESADLVFAYKSSGSSDDAQEYFGIPLSVPKAFRGGNVVLSFEYRTGYGTGTTATVDGDFEVAVLDKSTGNGGQTTTTATSGTAIAAGSNIAVASKTGLAVGQRVRLETGSSTIAAGSPDATVTEAFITSVSTSTDHITISKDYAPPSTSGGRITSGWLTDVVPGQLKAADSQTNKQGKKFSIQFKTEDDTSDIVLFFQNKNTSSTISRHLFVDNILLSANKFLQASSKGKPEIARYVTWTGVHDSYTPYYTTENENTFTGQYGTWQNGSSTTYTHFLASVKCKVTMSLWQRGNASGDNYVAIIINDLSSTDPSGTALNSKRVAYGKGLDNDGANCTAEVILNPGDTIRPASNSGVYSGEEYKAGLNIMVEPVENDVIILESQDEIFTDWQTYTPTFAGFTATNVNFRHKRVGSNMQIQGRFELSTLGGTTASLTIPSGYTLDTTNLSGNISSFGPYQYIDDGFYITDNSRSGVMVYNSTAGNENKLFFGFIIHSTGVYDLKDGTNTFGSGASRYVTIDVSIPIAGWNSNFNPLLSMPLQDFSSLENTFSARIACASTGASITSQSENFIASVSRSTTGVVAVTFASGFFSQAPAVTATVENAENSDRYINVYSVSSTGFTASIEAPTDFNPRDNNFNVVVTRQGSDFRKAPQATAAVIKPAVAVLRHRNANNVGAGTILASAGWQDMILNTMSGETWFVTLTGTGTTGVGGTNVDFTLEAGTYEMVAQFTLYNCNAYRTRLVDSAGNVILISSSEDAYANAGYMPGHSWVIDAFTVTSSTEFTFQTDVESNGDLGVPTNLGYDEIYSQVLIRKLK